MKNAYAARPSNNPNYALRVAADLHDKGFEDSVDAGLYLGNFVRLILSSQDWALQI